MRQGEIWFASSRLGKDALISNDGANALTAAAVVAVVPVGAARIEVEVVGIVRAVRALRGRPVVAALTSVEEAAAPAAASSGQEDAIAINLTGEFSSIHAIEHRPFAGTIVYQLLEVILGKHHQLPPHFW